MKNDFDLIVHRFDGPEPMTIYPLADVHLGAIEHNEKEWEVLVRKIAETPHAYVTLNGDRYCAYGKRKDGVGDD